ncbi:hypothetical protein J6590_087859, partial [Homalodisca vitripennis]
KPGEVTRFRFPENWEEAVKIATMVEAEEMSKPVVEDAMVFAVQCWNCNKPGHVKSECRQPVRNNFGPRGRGAYMGYLPGRGRGNGKPQEFGRGRGDAKFCGVKLQRSVGVDHPAEGPEMHKESFVPSVYVDGNEDLTIQAEIQGAKISFLRKGAYMCVPTETCVKAVGVTGGKIIYGEQTVGGQEVLRVDTIQTLSPSIKDPIDGCVQEPFGVVEEKGRKPVVGAHVWKVVMPCDIEVPELSEILVACVLKPTVEGQRFVNVDEVYVEPVSSELQVRSNEVVNICVARVISKLFKDSGASLVQCRLLNPHRSSVVLKKGRWLGNAAEVYKDNVVCIMLNQELFVKSSKKYVKSSVEEQGCKVIAGSSVGKIMEKEVLVGGVVLESDSKREGEIALVNKSEGGLALVNSNAGGKAWQSSDSGGEASKSKLLIFLARDIIEPSDSPWSSPIVLVKKKRSVDAPPNQPTQYRLRCDFRALNALTHDSIDKVLKELGIGISEPDIETPDVEITQSETEDNLEIESDGKSDTTVDDMDADPDLYPSGEEDTDRIQLFANLQDDDSQNGVGLRQPIRDTSVSQGRPDRQNDPVEGKDVSHNYDTNVQTDTLMSIDFYDSESNDPNYEMSDEESSSSSVPHSDTGVNPEEVPEISRSSSAQVVSNRSDEPVYLSNLKRHINLVLPKTRTLRGKNGYIWS